jgi:hypothetical protein
MYCLGTVSSPGGGLTLLLPLGYMGASLGLGSKPGGGKNPLYSLAYGLYFAWAPSPGGGTVKFCAPRNYEGPITLWLP